MTLTDQMIEVAQKDIQKLPKYIVMSVSNRTRDFANYFRAKGIYTKCTVNKRTEQEVVIGVSIGGLPVFIRIDNHDKCTYVEPKFP